MSKGFYVYLSSLQNLENFPDNETTHFRVQLPKTLHLSPKGAWSVGLVDIKTPRVKENFDKNNFFTINLSCVQSTIFEGRLHPVLYRLFPEVISRGQYHTIDNIRYVPLINEYFDTLHFYIKDSRDIQPSFEKGPVYCTLHFICSEP